MVVALCVVCRKQVQVIVVNTLLTQDVHNAHVNLRGNFAPQAPMQGSAAVSAGKPKVPLRKSVCFPQSASALLESCLVSQGLRSSQGTPRA